MIQIQSLQQFEFTTFYVANNKIYDGNTIAVTDGTGVTFTGMVGGDSLNLTSLSGTFSDKNVATGKTVTLTSAYGGTDVGNYSFTDQASTTADIMPANIPTTEETILIGQEQTLPPVTQPAEFLIIEDSPLLVVPTDITGNIICENEYSAHC